MGRRRRCCLVALFPDLKYLFQAPVVLFKLFVPVLKVRKPESINPWLISHLTTVLQCKPKL